MKDLIWKEMLFPDMISDIMQSAQTFLLVIIK